MRTRGCPEPSQPCAAPPCSPCAQGAAGCWGSPIHPNAGKSSGMGWDVPSPSGMHGYMDQPCSDPSSDPHRGTAPRSPRTQSIPASSGTGRCPYVSILHVPSFPALPFPMPAGRPPAALFLLGRSEPLFHDPLLPAPGTFTKPFPPADPPPRWQTSR